MSTLKVNKIRDNSGSTDAIVLDPSGGAVLAGVTTVSTVKVGSGVTISSDGDVFTTGVTTVSTVKVGSGVTISSDGDMFTTGITTSSSVIVGGGVTISESGIEASGIGITCANINDGQISGRRNIVINGAMQVAQRGTSFTATDGEYTMDRFKHEVGTSFNFDTTTTQSSNHPDGFKNSIKITPDSTQTPSGSENGAIRYQIEGQDVQQFAHGTSSAKPMTLSFYAKSASQNSGHVYSIQIRKYDPSDSRKYVLKPFTVTDSWQRFSFTFIGDTAESIIDSTSNGMELAWQLSSGPDDLVSEASTWASTTKFQAISGQNNFMDNTNNQFYLTGVQLEVGSQATAFEHRSFAEELALCQRYYQSGYFRTRLNGRSSDTISEFTHYFKGTMRTAPTVTTANVLGTLASVSDPDGYYGGDGVYLDFSNDSSLNFGAQVNADAEI